MIRPANTDLFLPRGLKAEVGKPGALDIGKIPILDSRGKINRQAPLLGQLYDLGRGSTEEIQELNLRPWIAEWELEILP